MLHSSSCRPRYSIRSIPSSSLCREVRALLRGKGSCWSIQCDVSDREGVKKAAEMTRAQCGRVTMLINNAGILPARPFLEFSDGETVRKIFEVNTYSQVSP